MSKGILTISPHNGSGFFSCCTQAIFNIIQYIQTNKTVPVVNFSKLFSCYQHSGGDSLYNYCFEELDCNVSAQSVCAIYNKYHFWDDISNQFSLDSHFIYSNIIMKDILPLIRKWFTPSSRVLNNINTLKNKYDYTFDNTLSIYYRGTDIHTDPHLPTGWVNNEYQTIIDTANSTLMRDSSISEVFIQTDQQQFLEKTLNHVNCDNIKYVESLPVTSSSIGCHFLDSIDKRHLAIEFLSSIYMIRDSKYLLYTTSNVSRWLAMYRGTTDNTVQFLQNKVISNIK